jgi:pimeloyl-ACP methyl ester carboxylesterase
MGSLAYERRGSGPPLVLVHGVGHRRQAWNAVVDLLTPQRTVITVDLPGHGESPPLRDPGPDPIAAIAGELFTFLDEQGLDRPHIAGNSLGGALALGAGAVGRAQTVTALSPAGFWASSWQFPYAKSFFLGAQLAGPVIRPLIPRLARSTLGRYVIDGAFVARPGKMPAEQAAGDARAFFRARQACEAILAQRAEFTDTLPADVKVTIAWGSKDRILPPSQALVARQRLPGARVVLLRGCGHVPMTDSPGLVARVLLYGSTPVG